MLILVLNAGSSSLKFRLYADDGARPVAGGTIDAFGDHAQYLWESDGQPERGHAPLPNHGAAARWALERLRRSSVAPLDAVAHRVVHGGEEFMAPVRITDDVLARLAALGALAPLHNPIALEVIHACRDVLGTAVPMAAVFDTAFHATLPECARTYALPTRLRAGGLRRYGFHGIAHRYMYERLCALIGRRVVPRVVTLHLGNGCSAAAIRDGASIDTSMGYTPLEGLVMATRPGDVDPGVLLALLARGTDVDELARGLNHDAGLLGLSGTTADMRRLLALEADGDRDARLAVQVFCQRARKYLGAYLAVLSGADAIAFGGGIGEHAAAVRARICAGMDWCGLRLDPGANAAAIGNECIISAADSAIAVHVVPVNEALVIARDACALLAQ